MRPSTLSLATLRKRQQHGLAIVEFVLTVPLLMFVLIATAEIGRAVYQYTALTKAVRDGARYLADQGDGTTGIPVLDATDLTRARNVTVFGNINGTGPALLPGLTTANITTIGRVAGTDYVQITARYNFQALFVPIPSLGVGAQDATALTALTATATQRSLK